MQRFLKLPIFNFHLNEFQMGSVIVLMEGVFLPINFKYCGLDLPLLRYIDMAERLCQKRALETFRLDPAKWGGKHFPIWIYTI